MYFSLRNVIWKSLDFRYFQVVLSDRDGAPVDHCPEVTEKRLGESIRQLSVVGRIDGAESTVGRKPVHLEANLVGHFNANSRVPIQSAHPSPVTPCVLLQK